MNARLAQNLKDISALATCNPFSPRRFELERKILKKDCEPFDSIAWNRKQENREGDRPNVLQLTRVANEIIIAVKRIGKLDDQQKQDYWNTATYLLLYRHITDIPAHEIWVASKRNQKLVSSTWENFWRDYCHIFDIDDQFVVGKPAAAHLFACLAQIHRAFFNIFDNILGESLPIAQLREKVWESIFTCCINRYHDKLFNKMRDLSTLITGPSGTGKELVARAIGMSQYAAFDHETCQFDFEPESSFLPLNLTALSPTLIESELFGHRKGAFTGAVTDRVGWLEACSNNGAVFLDEIGELDLGLQVKLLRVLQQRTYCRLGDTTQRTFQGKIIAATNRDLETEIANYRFREDFYFRICSDRIQTPSLREQLEDRPEDLDWLVESITEKQLGEESPEIASEISQWISANLGTDYPWHGNIRELEQCVRSFIIRQQYEPLHAPRSIAADAPTPDWLSSAVDGTVTADGLLRKYCTWVYSQKGSYEKTAKILNIDRRTVKAKLDQELLEEFKSGSQ